jgi:RHH-type proline utilization regulon transcriptional repressor/proline dehydrogenase/delta 1-pyrroline-5-carboxylate dehydrogenase
VDAPCDAVLFEGDSDTLITLAQEIAKRPGPILSVQTVPSHLGSGTEADYVLDRLLAERSVSVNTAAAGGNANLMTIA